MRTTEILLVDNNPADTDLTTEVLSRNGCPSRIHSVINGMEAVAFLHREGKYAHEILPDFVILDLNLPGKDGPCRARRSQRRPSAAEDSDRDLQYLRGTAGHCPQL
jgi:CheY-like chemotaxis protein